MDDRPDGKELWLQRLAERRRALPPPKSLARSLHQPYHQRHQQGSRTALNRDAAAPAAAGKGAAAPRPVLSSARAFPQRTANLHPGVTVPYRLDILHVENLPLPPYVSDALLASADFASLRCQLRVSLFDALSGAFFGNTWIAKEVFAIRPAEGDPGAGKKKPTKGSVRRGRTGTEDEHDDGVDIGNKDQGDRRNRSSFRSLNGGRYEDEAHGPRLALAPGLATLTGRNIEIVPDGQAVYFHTALTSPNIVAIIEYVVLAETLHESDGGSDFMEKADTKVEYVSAGWSYLPLFDPDHGGLDLQQCISGEGRILNGGQHSKGGAGHRSTRIDIISGSPRAVLFLQPSVNQASGPLLPNPVLTRLPNSATTVRITVDQSVAPFTSLWADNFLLGAGDHVPGLAGQVISSRVFKWKMAKCVKGTVSKLRLSLFPTVDEFEELLLTRVSAAFDQEHPSALAKDLRENPNSPRPLPTIIERRLHVGLHNTYTFLSPPHVTALRPLASAKSHAKHLEFSGVLPLDSIPCPSAENDEGLDGGNSVALVFIVEYKIFIRVEGQAEKKKGLLDAIADVLAKGETAGGQGAKEGIVKTLVIGWSVFRPSFHHSERTYQLALDALDTPPGVNAFVYFRRPRDNRDHTIGLDDSSQGSLPDPVELSFRFQVAQPQEKRRKISNAPPAPVIPRAAPPSPKPRETVQPPPSPPPQPLPRTPEPPPAARTQQPLPGPARVQELEEILPEPAPGRSNARSRGPAPPPPAPLAPRGVSRAARGRLLNANFPPPPVDENGQSPTPLISDGPRAVKMETEIKDPLQCNEVTVTIMGVTLFRAAETLLGDRVPSSAFFTFQFYNFDCTATNRYFLHTGDVPPTARFDPPSEMHRSASAPGGSLHQHNLSRGSIRSMVTGGDAAHNDSRRQQELGSADEIWPAILYGLGSDGQPLFSDPPGFSAKYFVDPRFDVRADPENVAEGHAFLRHLYRSSLYIDVWDGDSLVQLGSCSVQLRNILRQGRSGVVYIEDAELVFTQFSDDAGAPTPSAGARRPEAARDGGVSPQDSGSRSLVIGRVHLSITNIGRRGNSGERGPAAPRKRPVIVFDYREALRETAKSTTRKVLAKRLPEVDAELSELIRKEPNGQRPAGAENISPESGPPSDTSGKRTTTYKEMRRSRSGDLQTIQTFRDRRRDQTIRKALCENITATLSIESSFGQAQFFEFAFTNPYASEHSFEISFDDAELRVVNHVQEWKYLRRIHGVRASNMGLSLQDKPVHVRADRVNEMYLLPNETACVPFVYQSFLSGRVQKNGSAAGTCGANGDGTFAAGAGEECVEHGIKGRKIEIAVLNRQKTPVALLGVQIKPRYYTVERTHRLYMPENEVFRTVIKYHPMSVRPSTVFDSARPNQKYVRCSDDEAIVTLADKLNTNVHEVSIKYQCKQAPFVSTLYVLFYDDPYHTCLHEVWRVFIRSLKRVDINCLLGQASTASLVIRGASCSRNIRCYTTHPQDVKVQPDTTFLLAANSLNEVNLRVAARTVGKRDVILNVVDVEKAQLISSWLLELHCSAPTVTKAFELSLPLNQTVNKRASFTNPYPTRRAFYLRTNRERLLQFRSTLLDLDAGESQYIGMRFAPVQAPVRAEILVFINSAEGVNEECLSITADYNEFSGVTG